MTRSRRISIWFDLDVDVESWEQFIATYPAFKDETIEQTLIREAIAQWEWEFDIDNIETTPSVEGVV